MSIFKKTAGTNMVVPKYSIRVLDENWVETAQMLRKDYDKKWLEVTAATGIVDGEELPVTRLTFESTQDEYIDIRVKLALKKIDEINENEKAADKK